MNNQHKVNLLQKSKKSVISEVIVIKKNIKRTVEKYKNNNNINKVIPMNHFKYYIKGLYKVNSLI